MIENSKFVIVLDGKPILVNKIGDIYNIKGTLEEKEKVLKLIKNKDDTI